MSKKWKSVAIKKTKQQMDREKKNGKKGRNDWNLVFQHMKEGGFSCIIEAEKEDLGLLLPETEGGQDAIEPVNEEHWESRSEGI